MAIHQHEKDQDESQTTKKKKKKTTTTTTTKSKKDHDGSDGRRGSALLDDSDDRFAAALTRPRFLPAPKQKRTVEIDERFASVLTDERFRVGGGGVDGKRGVDKYGRRRSKTKENDDVEEGLRAFYTIKKKEDDDEKEDDDDDDDEDEEDDEPTDPDDRLAYLTALSRGEIEGDDSSTSSSSSSSSSDDDGDFSDDEEEDEEAPTLHGVLDPHGPKLDDDETEVELTHESSPYLAVTNLDWSHMRAVDLYAVLSSFAPPGSLRRVRVFPSDFGQEQMAKEERHGPDRAIFKTTTMKDEEKEDPDDGSDGSDDGEEDEKDDPQLTTTAVANTGDVDDVGDDDAFDTERLRRYEASKLRYYFAVAEFESDKAADVVYDEVDGVEMERTSAAVDLRCVPREALAGVVEGRPLRDQADALPSTYAPPDHVVAALQRTRLRCTWDEEYASSERAARLTDHEKWRDAGEDATDDLAVYMASDDDSDDDDDGEGDKKAAMRKMLGLDNDDDDDDENDEPTSMQVTYHPGKKDLEDKIRNKLDSKHKEEQTPWEKLQQKLKDKKKEKRKARKERLAAAENDDDDEATGNNHDLRDDDFFLTDNTKEDDTNDRGARRRTKGKKKRSDVATDDDDDDDDDEPRRPNNEPSTKEELELLLAGDDEVEAVRDYDMRGLVRADKHRDKKLRGVRGKKEARRAKALVGQNFEMDLKDERFSALLDGADDRFGVDVTDPLYKETPAMREVLRERTERRKKRRREGADGDHDGNGDDDDDVVAAKEEPSKPASDGAKRGDDDGRKEDDLSGLVKSLKNKVNRSDGRSRKKKKKSKK